MSILDDLISTLKVEAPVREICQGPFMTAVLTSGCGLAATPHDPGPHHDKAPVEGAGQLTEKSALDLALLAHSESPLEAAIGMAAINSLLDVDEGRCTTLNGADLLAGKGGGRRIALVGHFPFVPKLRQSAGELWVIEKNPREGDFAEDEAERLLPRADVVGITGTAIANHTIEHLLGLCCPDSYIVVLGGTTPLSEVLFDYGVDALSGTRVIKPDTLLRCVSQGATFRQLQGVRLLTMER